MSALPLRDPALELTAVFKQFGTVAALRGARLRIEPGRIHALLGENGAGKSTLVGIASGHMKPDGARIARSGRPVSWNSPRAARAEGVTMVPQHDLLVDNATVAENLALVDPAARLYESRHARTQRVLRAEKKLGLPLPPAGEIASRLPVGARQRIEIAGALLTEPQVLILDEPTAVLSPPEVQTLFSALRKLSDRGKAILVITHRLAEVFAAADELTVLSRGETILESPVGSVRPGEIAALILSGSQGGRREEVMAGLEEVSASSNLASATARGLPPLLEVASLAPEGSEVPSVSLELGRGEALTLLSIDGNGADVFASAIAGLRQATGTVRIDGHRVRTGDPESFHEAGGAVIPADRRLEGLFPSLPLRENFAVSSRRGRFWLKVADLEAEAAARISEFSIRASGPDALARELSGGNQQKVLLARALTPLPRLLVAINPARGLDLGSSAAVRDRLREALARGTTVLLVTSDPDEAKLFGAPIRVMYRGRLSPVLAPSASLVELGRYMAGLEG